MELLVTEENEGKEDWSESRQSNRDDARRRAAPKGGVVTGVTANRNPANGTLVRSRSE